MTVRYSKLLVSLGGMHQATKSASKHIFPARTRPITAGRGVFIGCGCRPWGCIDTRCTAWRFRFRLESLSIFQRRRSLLNLPQLSGFVYSYVHTCGHYCRCDSYCKRCASSTTTLWIKRHPVRPHRDAPRPPEILPRPSHRQLLFRIEHLHPVMR